MVRTPSRVLGADGEGLARGWRRRRPSTRLPTNALAAFRSILFPRSRRCGGGDARPAGDERSRRPLEEAVPGDRARSHGVPGGVRAAGINVTRGALRVDVLGFPPCSVSSGCWERGGGFSRGKRRDQGVAPPTPPRFPPSVYLGARASPSPAAVKSRRDRPRHEREATKAHRRPSHICLPHPLLLAPTAVPKDLQDQEDPGQEAEAEPAHPPVDPHAHRQHHPVRAQTPPHAPTMEVLGVF